MCTCIPPHWSCHLVHLNINLDRRIKYFLTRKAKRYIYTSQLIGAVIHYLFKIWYIRNIVAKNRIQGTRCWGQKNGHKWKKCDQTNGHLSCGIEVNLWILVIMELDLRERAENWRKSRQTTCINSRRQHPLLGSNESNQLKGNTQNDVLALLGASECLHGTSNWENLCTGSASDTEFCFVDLRSTTFTLNLVRSTVFVCMDKV